MTSTDCRRSGRIKVADPIEKSILGADGRGLTVALEPVLLAAAPEVVRRACFHCGEPCPTPAFGREEKVFCCQGCLIVHDLLAENGLTHFYDLNAHPGVRISRRANPGKWDYLNQSGVQEKLLDFTDGKQSRVTLHVPAIHCVACVWLLENLFRLHPGIGHSRVNFPRREVSLSFNPSNIRLSEVAALLDSIGYEPSLTLGELERPVANNGRARQWLQVGIAGFAFGNIMLFSLPGYIGLDSLSGPTFRAVFGYISLALASPVLLYSASDYWRSAWLSFRQKVMTLDVPIALGLAALYGQSAFEIVSGRGEGYLDSLSGLVFFLLCGRVFQQKTHERMVFDRDYKCFFPLSVTRLEGEREQVVAISTLKVGDCLRLRNGELLPADARLIKGPACIDYSFVTGESDPAAKQPGDTVFAGGKQVGGVIELEILKPVSQSYLTSLWDDEAFKKEGEDTLNTLTNRYSRRFTRLVIGVACVAGLGWIAFGDGPRGMKAFASVLIVACPCALALAAPFTLGTGQRLLARSRVFLKNAQLLEKLAKVDTIVFDKTGTLTEAGPGQLRFESVAGTADQLTGPEIFGVWAVASQSTHPHSVLLTRALDGGGGKAEVEDFEERPGAGVRGRVRGVSVLAGSASWLIQQGVKVPDFSSAEGSQVYVALEGRLRGRFIIEHPLRPQIDELVLGLSRDYEVTLLSGDNERERERFTRLFGHPKALHFNQSPADKLAFVRRLQEQGKRVMMVGDGLNDAGALKQSDVGVAVVENVGAFSPASDVILPAGAVTRLPGVLDLAGRATRIVRWGFGISAFYNLAGVGIAAAGILSPIICAVLMPVSSISVVLFACGRTRWAARKAGFAS